MSQLQDLVALIRADTPLIVIETPDEQRVVELFRQTLTHAAEGFSGAEIEQAIVAASYAAHAQNVPLSEFQLRAELKQARPLSVLMREQVQALRDWARERTVPAD